MLRQELLEASICFDRKNISRGQVSFDSLRTPFFHPPKIDFNSSAQGHPSAFFASNLVAFIWCFYRFSIAIVVEYSVLCIVVFYYGLMAMVFVEVLEVVIEIIVVYDAR